MSNNSLLERFKKIYEEGNLKVVIVNAAGKEQFRLTVKEYPSGEIYWY